MTEWMPAGDEQGSGEPAAWLDGTDPAGWADTTGDTDPFPPPVQLDVVPADGRWTDPDLLGRAAGGDPATDPAEALRADLAAAVGDPEADWAALRDSDDPAVRALAMRWHR
jgi:hypothetical protein